MPQPCPGGACSDSLKCTCGCGLPSHKQDTRPGRYFKLPLRQPRPPENGLMKNSKDVQTRFLPNAWPNSSESVLQVDLQEMDDG